MQKRLFLYILFTFALISTLSFSNIWEQIPTYPCHKSAFITTKSPKIYIYPEKVLIRPWLGQHHVYGIFMLPIGYSHDQLMTVNIPGTSKQFCGNILEFGETLDGINAKPGHYLAKGYLQTRTAVRFIIQGKIKHLQQLKNWRLGYVKE
ncbi:hypothetical protein VB711_09270 [Cronbergia sp. UHCC 0137]|uniref:hypothetical protein n=1 Tax=Cronbergia sp. UHCC 0137 TaxID=3110239 RepID=UPI002B215D8A|nr:hypothetical protein [Cronbergia sp. UHCC 0137]MEA5618025.1 hypothetical protein [Cronbergia sp. UHCC 0137]